MQRARRLASVAVAACLTVGGLSACQREPDVAIYWGSGSKTTIAEVQRIYDDARTKLETQQGAAGQTGAQTGASAAALGPVQVPISGPDVVSVLVSREIGNRLAQAAQVTIPNPLPLAEVGQALALPADAEYVKLYAESRLLFAALLDKAAPGQATDADIRHIFDIFEATGAMQPGVTYEQFKGGVSPEAIAALGKAITLKQQAQAQVDQLGVRVNPRYGTSEVPVFTENGPDNKPLSLVSVPLTEADASPVLDAS
ncbi:hypothetical protein AB0M20_04800 [Actinoplanes sp. NPDC051633]|uniref:hypothetical protein n=1 Tax=Actinoplanes sp. NPDC051633 TaxID=3155670 RepID=UPI00344116B9